MISTLHVRTTKESKDVSYLFFIGAVKIKSLAVLNLSMGSPVPAKAQAPRGQKFTLSLQSISRPASRSSCAK
jgi:hypothetical protein